MSADEPTMRSIERVGFDRFFGPAPQRSDGVAVQRGADSDGNVMVVGSVSWPAMTTYRLALSSRDGRDHLDLDVDVDDQPTMSTCATSPSRPEPSSNTTSELPRRCDS